MCLCVCVYFACRCRCVSGRLVSARCLVLDAFAPVFVVSARPCALVQTRGSPPSTTSPRVVRRPAPRTFGPPAPPPSPVAGPSLVVGARKRPRPLDARADAKSRWPTLAKGSRILSGCFCSRTVFSETSFLANIPSRQWPRDRARQRAATHSLAASATRAVKNNRASDRPASRTPPYQFRFDSSNLTNIHVAQILLCVSAPLRARPPTFFANIGANSGRWAPISGRTPERSWRRTSGRSQSTPAVGLVRREKASTVMGTFQNFNIMKITCSVELWTAGTWIWTTARTQTLGRISGSAPLGTQNRERPDSC